jgi:hypothetical protein
LEIKTRCASRITAAEIKSMRITAGYTWTDHETNMEIAKELNVTQVSDKVQDYKVKWIQHVNTVPRNRLSMITEDCRPKGRRNPERPLKRLLNVSLGSTSGSAP